MIVPIPIPIRPFEIGQTVTITSIVDAASDTTARWIDHQGTVIDRWQYDSEFIQIHKLSGWMYEVRFPNQQLFVTAPYFHEELTES